MIALGITLAAVGAGDIVAGLSGRLEPAPRPSIALALSSLLALALGLAAGLGAAAPALAAFVAGAMALWLFARKPERWSPARATATLWGVAVVLGALLSAAALWPDSDGGAIARWLEGLPYPAAGAGDPARVVLVGGAMLWLTASGNALVRLLLAAVGTDAGEAEQTLRGGRIIGPMERILIFGFLVGGQATAAAVVVSAKSLLRFPEMRADKPRIDVLTEYFLVGSFASWLIALAPVPLT